MGNRSSWQLEGEQPLELFPEEIRAEFREEVSEKDLGSFLAAFGARVLRPAASRANEKRVPGQPVVRFITFDPASPLDTFSTDAKRIGMPGGRYVFSDRKVAVTVQQVMRAWLERDGWKLSHIGIDGPRTLFSCGPYPEGGGTNTPTSDEFWYQDDWRPGRRGNQISCAWQTASGNGVKVAVVDQGFINGGEAITAPPNTQLLGLNAALTEQWNVVSGSQTGIPDTWS